MIESGYPKRPRYFANRYCRLLAKTCAAQDLGHVGFTLCVTIAHLEDAKRYTGPVTFFNEQLMPVIGVLKWRTLDKARKRAVEAGWLHYENPGNHRPGRYWVTIPEGLENLDDTPCDESQYAQKGDRLESQYAQKGYNRGDNRGYNRGELSYLTLNPIPKKESARADAPPEGLLKLIDLWNAQSPGIVKPGNGARREPPSQAAVKGWTKATRDSEQREAFKDLDAVARAIEGATFCHGKGWFTLPWLFGKNKNGEFNITKLLAGAYDGDNPASKQARRDSPARIR